jgi:hypothetical protein
MNCSDVQSRIAEWEDGRSSLVTNRELQDHIASCTGCRKRYGSLLPLLAKDIADGIAGSPFATERADPKSCPPGFADKIMNSVAPQRRAHRYVLPLSTAAALLIFVLGLSLGLFFSRSGTEMVEVHFFLSAPDARTVHLAGDFNNWSSTGYEMRKNPENGTWEISVRLPRDKIYAYNFILDDERWIADPASDVQVDDGYGGQASLLSL